MSNTNKWIFIELAHEGEKTCKWYVINRRSEGVIGEIKWYGPWRQYCFFPVIGSVFNPDCMDFINEFIREEMANHKRVLASNEEAWALDIAANDAPELLGQRKDEGIEMLALQEELDLLQEKYGALRKDFDDACDNAVKG